MKKKCSLPPPPNPPIFRNSPEQLILRGGGGGLFVFLTVLHLLHRRLRNDFCNLLSFSCN